MSIIIIMLCVILWTVAGYFINAFYGLAKAKELAKYYENADDMNRDLMIRNYNKVGTVSASNAELISDAFFWPATLYKAHKGQKRIIEDLEGRK